MKTSRLRILCLVMLILGLSIPTSIAIANSLPPPYRVWFRFVNEKDKAVEVTGLHIAGCVDDACVTPEYLIGFGKCTGVECFTGQPKLSDPWKLACVGNRCILENPVNFTHELPAYLQLRIDNGKDSWQSSPFVTPECNYCDTRLKVTLAAGTGMVAADTDSTLAGEMQMNFWPAWLVTIMIECLAASGIEEIWKRRSPGKQVNLWIGVLLANLLSYPVAWVTIPSLGQMQLNSAARSGLVILVVSLFISAIALFIAARRGKMRGWMIVTGVVLIPVFAALVLAALFLSSYGNYDINVSGLPPAAVIILAEFYAVGFEALFLWLLKKKTLLFRQALLISAVLNILSAGIGFLIF